MCHRIGGKEEGTINVNTPKRHTHTRPRFASITHFYLHHPFTFVYMCTFGWFEKSRICIKLLLLYILFCSYISVTKRTRVEL